MMPRNFPTDIYSVYLQFKLDLEQKNWLMDMVNKQVSKHTYRKKNAFWDP